MTMNEINIERNKCFFVRETLEKYTTNISEITKKHGFLYLDASGIINKICSLASPEHYHDMCHEYRVPLLSINKLRLERKHYLVKINELICSFTLQLESEKENMSVKSNPEISATEAEPLDKTVNKKDTNMNIIDIVKLRRLTSTSVALTSLLENVYVINETRYAHYSVSSKQTLQKCEQPYQEQSLTYRASNNNTQQQNFQNPNSLVCNDLNPYDEISFTKDQLNKADEKIMELLQILFPDENHIQS